MIQVNKPFAFPCFGVFKKEKYCILPSISDVVVEQGKPNDEKSHLLSTHILHELDAGNHL